MNTDVISPVTQRLKYLDAAKGIGILMVVFGHITSLGNPVDTYFSAYKLSIFYIVSGYLLCMRQTLNRYEFKPYVWKQLKSLMLPYFGYSVIVMIYNIFIDYLNAVDKSKMLHDFLDQLYATVSLRGISALWFLPSLLIGQVLFFIILKSPKLVQVASAILALLLADYMVDFLPTLEETIVSMPYKIVYYPLLTLSKGLIAFWFIGSGYLCYFLLKNLKNRNIRFLLGVLFTLSTIYLSQKNPGVDLNLMSIGENSTLFYINGILGAMGAVLILEYLEKWWKMSFLTFCGKYSLVIMSTHGTLGYKTMMIAGWKEIATVSDEYGLRYYFECICILINLMLLEYGVIRIVENHLPWLMGNARNKK